MSFGHVPHAVPVRKYALSLLSILIRLLTCAVIWSWKKPPCLRQVKLLSGALKPEAIVAGALRSPGLTGLADWGSNFCLRIRMLIWFISSVVLQPWKTGV